MLVKLARGEAAASAVNVLVRAQRQATDAIAGSLAALDLEPANAAAGATERAS